MPAEDLMRVNASRVARRRVRRGTLWLIENIPGWFVPLWAANPGVFIPQREKPYERHVLVQALSYAPKTSWKYPPEWRSGNISYEAVKKHFKLSPLFLQMHGFATDELLTYEVLNRAWHEMLWSDELVRLVKERRERKIDLLPMRRKLH